MNLLHIAEGWVNLYAPTPFIRHAAQERLSICESCEEKQPNPPLIAGLLRHTVPSDRQIYAYACRACGCFLAAKAHSPEAKCPLGKWGPMPEDTDHLSPSLLAV